MPNRTEAPPLFEIDQLHLPPVQIHYLDNGIPVYEIRTGTQEVVRLELVFKAGRPYEKKKLAGRATAALLKEGTATLNGATIAEQIDFYGGSLNMPFNMDTANIILYSLCRHVDKLLPILQEMLDQPAFPRLELESFVHRNQQLLQEDLSKNDVVAYRTVTENIFGVDHPYGYNSSVELYGALDRPDLLDHFGRNYSADNCTIFLCGKSNETILSEINKTLGKMRKGQANRLSVPPASPTADTKMHLPHPGAVQSAVRIGRQLFSRQHPDYHGMYVLNNILGGYFGSRLMANVREEKGYTYNIYSMLDIMQADGSMYIGTEVGNEFLEPALEEIYLELELLREEPVLEEELSMVKNYLMGNFLTMLDGPFNVCDIVKTLVTEDLPPDYFEQMVDQVRTMDALRLQELARQYFRPQDMFEVVVG